VKRTNQRITGAIFGTLAVAFLSQFANAQPSGTITTNISSSTNLVWDFSAAITNISFNAAFHSGTVVNISYPVITSQNGAGVISGGALDPAATLTVLGHSFPFSGGKYKVNGTFTSNKGKGHVLVRNTVSGTVSGLETRRVNANHTVNIRFDNTAQTVTGKQTDNVAVHPPVNPGEVNGHGSVSINSPLSAVFAGDGSWTLSLSGIATTGKKVLGTATVVLNSGRTFNYNVHGLFSSSTGISKLTLTAADKSTRGSVLHVSLNENAITIVRGAISGQSVIAFF
jgi:hypothetical protein